MRACGSISRIRFSRVHDSSTPCACGVAPPDKPVPAPRATTGTLSRLQVSSTCRSCSSVFRQLPGLVVLPRTEEQLRQVLLTCSRLRVPVVARGAGTGLSGGATPHAQDRKSVV